jgi:hypothetical protein
VIVRGGSGSQFELGFSAVASLAQHRAEGMVLYAVVEMKADPPLRRFVFTNWDDGDDARLELVAREIECRPFPSDRLAALVGRQQRTVRRFAVRCCSPQACGGPQGRESWALVWFG